MNRDALVAVCGFVLLAALPSHGDYDLNGLKEGNTGEGRSLYAL